MKRLWISFTIFIFLTGCTTTLAVDLKQVYAKISEEKQLPKLIEVDKEAVEQIYEFDMEQVKQFAIIDRLPMCR